jgi:hypothetical protein
MTIQDVARSEGIGERQAQRYCREGYQGHVLKAARVGRGLQITLDDYKAWRIACGFDTVAPETECNLHPVPEHCKESLQPPSGSEPQRPITPTYPPYPQPADPNGVLTNVPHEHSRNMPHPLAVADHQREENRKEAQSRGYDDEN